MCTFRYYFLILALTFCRCRRLALTPLSYLWQRDQAELLSEMVEAGLVAILIKVAGVGLTTQHLGKTLGQMQPTLQKLVSAGGAQHWYVSTENVILTRTRSTDLTFAAKVESTRL